MLARLRLLVLALAACALLSACGSGRGGDCNANRDCPAPQLCVSGRCVDSGCGPLSNACDGDADCGLGRRCTNGCCRSTGGSGCQADEDCASRPSTPYCHTANGACVQCVQARDCGQGKLCQNNSCQAQPGCARDADCTNAALPVCDAAQKACVQCLQSADCRDGAKPICDASHKCVAPPLCHSNADCAKPVPICQGTTNTCVQCLTDTDCPSTSQCSPQLTCVVRGNGNCQTDSDCAGNATTPHCKQGTGGSPGVCVACTDSAQCGAGTVCAADNTCQVKQCTGDGDCPASSPRCDLGVTPHACVACLGNPDCPNGGTCQPDHSCQAYSGPCRDNRDCADASKPQCKVVGGGPNVCVCTSASCPSGQVCNAQGACQVPQCTKDSDCAAGQKCAGNVCKPICTAATQGQDCAAPAPVCKESPTGNACVACVKDADCNDAAKICSSSNTCIARPAACDAPPSCTASGNCCPAGTVCKTAVSPRQCVQCLGNGDCTNGYLCDTASNTCKPPPVGAEGQPCRADFTCNAGFICVDEGGRTPVCRTICDPYAAGNPCAPVPTDRVCSWIDFDGNGKLFGFCDAKSGAGAAGAACDPRRIDGCEWNLFCRPTSEATGICATLCDPAAASTCASGSCNKIVGGLSPSGASRFMGYCGPASKWGQACVRDAPSGTPAPPGDCGFTISSTKNAAALYCAATALPAEFPSVHVAATCQFTPAAATAVGGAASDCTQFGHDQCRTGVCLADGPATCYAGCSATADCNRDEDSFPCSAGGCSGANPTFCMDYPFDTGQAVSRVPSCVPRCRNESDCAGVGSTGFARTCVAQATHGGSSWQTYCAPVGGAGRAGAKCASSGDCESGVCFTAATLQTMGLGLSPSGFTPTDGFCLGSCLPPNTGVCGTAADGTTCTTADTRQGSCSGGTCRARCGGSFPACTIGDRCVSGLCEMNECGSASGMHCDDVAALPLRPSSTGNLGVTGYPRYGACFGGACAHDADCSGASKDAANPRVCAPYRQTYTQNTDLNKACTGDPDCTGASYAGICNSAANNPNPGGFTNGYGLFGQNGKCRSTLFALQCAPSLGAAKKGGGAACAKSSDCRTGHCLVLPDGVPIEAKAGATAGVCFASCTSNADCAAGTCKASSYLGMAGLKACLP